MLRLSPDDHYECTQCGSCCRIWNIPLLPGEADRFERAGEGLVPVERLRRVVVRGERSRLELRGELCPALGADKLCAIHAHKGPEAKPAACNTYPYVHVRAPDGDEVHLAWSCPAVVDAHGPALSTQADALAKGFAAAVQNGFVTEVPERVRLTGRRSAPFADLRALLGALDRTLAAEGTLIERVCRMEGVVVGFEEACATMAPTEAAAAAEARAPELAAERAAGAIASDWRGRGLLRSMTQHLAHNSRRGAWASTVGALRALVGGRPIGFLDGAETTADAIEAVAPALPADGEALLVRWLRAQLRGLAFFGAPRFGLTVYQGIDLLVLLVALAVHLARAHAAAASRAGVERGDVAAAVQLIETGFLSRPTFFAKFGPALTSVDTVDLLRAELRA